MSDKLKEVANHTRQFSKKKRTQSNHVPQSPRSNSSKEISKASKITRVEEDLSQEQPRSEADPSMVDVVGTNNDISCSKQSNDSDNFPSLKSFDNPQTIPNRKTVKRKDEYIVPVNISESRSDEQITASDQCDASLSIPKLNSISIERNSQHMGKSRSVDISDPATSSVSKSLATDLSLCKDNEQRKDKEMSPRLFGTTTCATMATTTTTTARATIVPYASILAHLKTPGYVFLGCIYD